MVGKGRVKAGGLIQHIYLDERYHGTGVSSNTLQTHVLRLITRPMRPWFVASPDVPFLGAARDQTDFWKTEFQEMKLEIEPRPCSQTQDGRMTREKPSIPIIRLRQRVDGTRIIRLYLIISYEHMQRMFWNPTPRA